MNNTIIEILIDNSGSMGYVKGDKENENSFLIDGQTRMSLIKKILLDEIIPTINYSSYIYIRTFRASFTKENDEFIQKDIEILLIYEGEFNKTLIEEYISKLEDPPIGGTPISAALEESFKNLKKYPQYDRKIILLTDCEENVGGNYIETAKKIEALKGIKCKIFIIGLALDEKSEKAVKKIANGGFYNLKSKIINANEVKQALAPLKAMVFKDTISNLEQIKKGNKPPQNISTIENIVKKKINDISLETKIDTENSLEKLETKIKEYISTGQEILNELSILKERIQLNALIEPLSIDSTTLTIDDEYSESIRLKSETILYKILCKEYGNEKVDWLNKDGENFKPYDFELYDEQNNVCNYIECKATPKEKPTFYMTDKEWDFFIKNRKSYQVYRFFNLDSDISYYCIDNLFNSLMSGEVVPYLIKPEILKENRVYLTLINNNCW